ncbi:uncharacterized protein LOC130967840 [Arachis stenosperma]|uniref:uncharacterized protein LOC130967840 n=1 Tax=Arachis stenosperma TaxID=217475 RepID=UPI0025AC2BFA|nr:uncharacterized protein LOC130967840 [Arachis stenosperma]
MEIEGSQAVVANKVWNIVRVLFFMLRKGIAKSKLVMEFHSILKRGKLAGKALLNTLIFNHHHHHLTCRSHDTHLSFISPRLTTDYEFSCSNSPAVKVNRLRSTIKRTKHHSKYDDVSTLTAVQKVLEMLNNTDQNKVDASPLVTLSGFGKSPIGKQLRVTDSPFPLKDEGDNGQVDMAAEEFIRRFYKELNMQKKLALESPNYHNYYSTWDR